MLGKVSEIKNEVQRNEVVNSNKSDDGKTVSYWEASENLVEKTSLNESIETDICIIGGGIAGLTTAYFLTKAGRKVIIIDDGLIGGGTSARTTAHLSNAIDDRIYRIIEWHGQDKAKLAVEAHARAIDEIEKIINDEKIECDFARVDGYLVEAEDGEDDLEKEFEVAQTMMPVEKVSRAPLTDFETGECLKFPNQAQFHILKFLNGLTKIIEKNGGTIFSKTRAVEWKGENNPQVKTESGQTIQANKVVLATNYPLFSQMYVKLPAYRSYVIGVKIPKDSVEKCLIWDTANPYRYVRTQPEKDYDVLIVGGEDHRTGQANDAPERFQKLWQWTKKRFPQCEEILYEWSGQFFETHDGLAFIGQFSDTEPNVFLITGDSGMGMTHGTIGGMMVSDLILGRENAWTEVFNPSRIFTQSITEAVPEIINSITPYVDWLKGGDVSSVDDIKPGEGAIISENAKKIATYRDENGKLFQKSAICTHLGCLVRFNSLEKTWDCPCHGSRFCINGEPINSPAVKPLEEIDNK